MGFEFGVGEKLVVVDIRFRVGVEVSFENGVVIRVHRGQRRASDDGEEVTRTGCD